MKLLAKVESNETTCLVQELQLSYVFLGCNPLKLKIVDFVIW